MSLDLDGELSRFEQALLRRHLGRCARCAQQAHGTAAVTALLRSQPLEQMSVPVGVARRRLRLTVVQSVSAVAAVVVAGTWLGLSTADPRPGRPAAHTVPRATSAPKVVATDGRFDWQAGGPVRGQPVVLFVPGGLHMSDS